LQSLESVDEALVKLENLLQELHLSSSNSGKEDLKAACSDLEMIRRLKKEAEFLEAYFRAKAEYLEVSSVLFLSLCSVIAMYFPIWKKLGLHASSETEVISQDIALHQDSGVHSTRYNGYEGLSYSLHFLNRTLKLLFLFLIEVV
jgi:hypothetical protein